LVIPDDTDNGGTLTMARAPTPKPAVQPGARRGSSLARRVFAGSGFAAVVLVITILAVQLLSAEREADRAKEQGRLAASAAVARLSADADGLRRLLQSVAATLPEPHRSRVEGAIDRASRG
jgi:hypothetical protein